MSILFSYILTVVDEGDSLSVYTRFFGVSYVMKHSFISPTFIFQLPILKHLNILINRK